MQSAARRSENVKNDVFPPQARFSSRALFAPQAQLLETAKSVGPEALFKQVVKFEQIDPLWSILGENKGGPYCRKFEIT